MGMDLRMQALRNKATAVLGDVVVSKSHHTDGVMARLPRYVSDQLIAAYGVEEASRQVARHFPAADRREWMRHTLVQQGTVSLLDQVTVRIDLAKGVAKAHLSAFGEWASVSDTWIRRFPELLGAGMWGRVVLRYRFARETEKLPMVIEEFVPLSTQVDLAQFIAARAAFSLDEWMDLWLLSLGYQPEGLVATSPEPHRVKWLVLSRLLPLVEPQYNLLELGPKNIGKTYLYRNATPGAFVVSGGVATPAHLFVNLRSGEIGILGRTECVVFDEVAGLDLQEDWGTMSILKDYMESGHYSRGGRDYTADASLVLLGNIVTEGGQPSARYGHLLEDLPASLLDPAILDRVHGFLPGWEIPKLTPRALDVEWGLASDYVAAVLHALRWWPVEDSLSRLMHRHPVLPDVTRRDQRAIEKSVRGLLKLCFPDGRLSVAESHQVLALASELRQRVHQQLVVIDPGEFVPRAIGFTGVTYERAPDLERQWAWTPYDRRLNQAPHAGEVTGLLARVDAEGQIVDGDVQVIEASVLVGAGELRLTGFRGRAMEESARAAFHYLKEHLPDFRLPGTALSKSTMAVHLVSIALPREGPSAGLAFLLAMVSALTGRPVRPGLAVTGEVSLHGNIDAVGGLAAKLYAAWRHGRRIALVPEANREEVRLLPKVVCAEMEIRLVGSVGEALREAFQLAAATGAASDRASGHPD